MWLSWLAAALAAAPSAIEIPPYRSAFADYRAWRADEPTADWRRANDDVRRLGGHAGHLREAPSAPGERPLEPKGEPR